MKIGFIGLGKLGLPCALAINSKGHEVWGYDIDKNVAETLETKKLTYLEEGAEDLLKTHKINFGSIKDVVKNSDIIFVPIQTPHDYKFEGCTRIPEERDDFNYEPLKKGIESLSSEIIKQSNEKIVVIISTVLPGTIEREIYPIIKYNFNFILCYNPYFIAMGTTIQDFLNPEFILFGSEDKRASKLLKNFYETIHNKPFYQTSIKNAELIKVSYNTFIGMKIVFANTIMEMCHRTGADVDEVMGAIKMADERLISPKYLNGGMGDGGGCHPRDNIAMSWLSNKIGMSYNFFDDIMNGREKQTEFLCDLILEYPGPYYIMGKTFKENTNLILGSPSILLCNILKEKNITFVSWDPYVDKDKPDFKKGTYFVATKHDEFKSFDFPSESVVIDIWRYLTIADSTIKHVKVGKNNICH
jgi:UDPglucose 6-dehydrogenase